MKNKTFFWMILFFILIALSACSDESSSSSEYITGVKAIAAGDSHTVALKNDGTVFAWGLNNYGQLGDGTYTDRNTPAPVRAPEITSATTQERGLTGITAISARGYRTVALRNDGTVWAWGKNYYVGQRKVRARRTFRSMECSRRGKRRVHCEIFGRE